MCTKIILEYLKYAIHCNYSHPYRYYFIYSYNAEIKKAKKYNIAFFFFFPLFSRARRPLVCTVRVSGWPSAGECNIAYLKVHELVCKILEVCFFKSEM